MPVVCLREGCHTMEQLETLDRESNPAETVTLNHRMHIELNEQIGTRYKCMPCHKNVAHGKQQQFMPDMKDTCFICHSDTDIRYNKCEACHPEHPRIAGDVEELYEIHAEEDIGCDDCHIEAWKPYGVSGQVWEALTFVWNERANTAEKLAELLAVRNYSQEEYQAALDSLTIPYQLVLDMAAGEERRSGERGGDPTGLPPPPTIPPGAPGGLPACLAIETEYEVSVSLHLRPPLSFEHFHDIRREDVGDSVGVPEDLRRGSGLAGNEGDGRQKKSQHELGKAFHDAP